MLVRMPNLGLNAQITDTALDPRAAVKGSQNVVYEYGSIRTPWGFDTVDMAAGLNSGDTVLHVFQWAEVDRTTHLTAVTTEKIYDHDRVNNTWVDKTQSGVTMSSNIFNPVSYAEVGHDDTNIYFDEDTGRSKSYHHLIVCDGGLSNIQRWAGKNEADFADLLGGGGYHDGTTHRALQVSLSQHNRLLLISPRAYSSSSALWVENPQRVRWPTIGKIQTWTGTGSGFADLMDTGGINVWSASLGSQHIIYQTTGIWTLMYVGGETVFDPEPYIRDLGLLHHHLLVSHNNVHYFVGSDHNVYAYYGGTVIKDIGDPIHRHLIDDLDEDYTYRCWMAMGPKAKFLWILIVPNGATYITKAYRRNMATGAWCVRDFSGKWTTTSGVTAISLAAANAYTIGETYAEALDTISTADVSDGGDATVRYGDKLLDASRTLTKDLTQGTWSQAGSDYSLNAENFKAEFTDNDMMVVFDGSDATNTRTGTHYYTVYDVSTNGFSVRAGGRSTGVDFGIADVSTNTPADLSVAGNDTIGFYSTCSEDTPGQTYNQILEQIRQRERLVMGDSGGFVYQIDETYATDDGNNMDCRHLTPVFDWNEPSKYKLWPGLSVVAKGSSMTIRYRTDNFDTSDTGWNDLTQALTSDYEQYNVWANKSSKRIQACFKDFTGEDFDLREYEIMNPLVEENR
jgi:hypothetical protein